MIVKGMIKKLQKLIGTNKNQIAQLTSAYEVEGKTIKEVIRCNKVIIFICDDNTHFIVDGLRVYDAFDYTVGITTRTAHDILADYKPIASIRADLRRLLVKLGHPLFKFPIYYRNASKYGNTLRVEFGKITETTKTSITFENQIITNFKTCNFNIKLLKPKYKKIYLREEVKTSESCYLKALEKANNSNIKHNISYSK